jgi:molybdopterin molybdotransferase
MAILSVRQALAVILDSIAPLSSVEATLETGWGMVLAEDVAARDDVPAADNSAMDGFAVRTEDLESASETNPITLRIQGETLYAGVVPGTGLAPRAAMRIMTGGLMPQGADAVAPQETVEIEKDAIIVRAPVDKGEHLRKAGEDFRAGRPILLKGVELTPSALAVAAAAGRDRLHVHRRPRVAVLACGDELVPPGAELTPGKVRNANTAALSAQIRAAGADAIDLGVARDERLDLRERVALARRADAIVVSAGMSVGERDLARSVLEEEGMATKFWRVHVKPGRPLLFGILSGIPVFGLPGNPVSTQVTFELFVRPALRKMLGHRRFFRPMATVTLQHEIRRHPGRPEFVRVRLDRTGELLAASLTRGAQGSGISTSLLDADGLLFIEEETVFIPAGDRARCLLLDPTAAEAFTIS